MSSGDYACPINVEIHAIFGWQANGKLIDNVLSSIHNVDFLAFWIHINCEPKPTHGIGYWQYGSESNGFSNFLCS
jgi:hypothetical protein